MVPRANIPATAVATLAQDGRRRAIQVGANVVMPNLSPPHSVSITHSITIRVYTGGESAEGIRLLEEELLL